MAQMQNAQSAALQLEKVLDKLPLLYERDDILLTMIQQLGDAERVSSRNIAAGRFHRIHIRERFQWKLPLQR
jgi:hypothetical protein